MSVEKTAEQYRAEAAAHRQEARDSFERCDTDGFLSQWASGINAQLADAQAKLAEAGGIATFQRTILLTLDGETTDARRVETRYGTKWRLDSTDQWLAYMPERESTLAKKGYKEATIEAVAPARAKTWAPPGAKGLSGAHLVRVITERADELPGGGRELREWRCIGCGDLTGEG
jgi:hypothetical protein